MSDDGLDVLAVARRFDDVGAHLDELKDRLQAIKLAEDVSTDGARSLVAASASLGELVGQLAAVADEISTAVRPLAETLQVARKLMESADIAELRAEVTALRSQAITADDLRTIHDEIAATREAAITAADLRPIRSAFRTVREKLEELGDLQDCRQQLAALQERHDALIARIPGRQKGKLGLD